MDWTAIVIAAVIGLPGLYFGWVGYRDRLPKRRIEYVVVTNYGLVPQVIAESVKLLHGEVTVDEPALVVVRMVNAGNSAITEDDFSGSMVLTFENVTEVPYAIVSGHRPADLAPRFEAQGNELKVAPLLLNPGDLIEFQCLTSHRPGSIRLGGRIRDVEFERRSGLPYPPGSGEEGEMIGFDRFMWWLVVPAMILGVGALVAADSTNSPGVRIAALAGALFVALGLYPVRVRQLVRRRRLWRPQELPPGRFWRH